MMDLPKMIQAAIAKSKAEADGFVPHIYLTISQANEIVKVQEQLQAELEEYRWIPVSERLPENVRDVWILDISTGGSSGGADVGFYGDGKWEKYGCGLTTEVTYWKPIILPKQDPKETR